MKQQVVGKRFGQDGCRIDYLLWEQVYAPVETDPCKTATIAGCMILIGMKMINITAWVIVKVVVVATFDVVMLVVVYFTTFVVYHRLYAFRTAIVATV